MSKPMVHGVKGIDGKWHWRVTSHIVPCVVPDWKSALYLICRWHYGVII